MKNIALLILFCSYCAVSFSQESKNVSTSIALLTSFQKNEYEKATSDFDETMKNALPATKLKFVWEDLNTKCGKFQKYSTITEGKIQTYDVTYILCHFEKVNLKMKVVFNDKNQVAGLFFVPE